MGDRVLVAIADGVATVTLNRPEKLNALDVPLCGALTAALRQLPADQAVRAVIVTGAGRAFCAGADLGVLGPDGAKLVTAGKDIALAIRNAPVPVIAAVNGAAAGGGANLALACDYRIASDQAAIGQVFNKLGLSLDWGGSYFLPRLTTLPKALELTWSARMVPATEALALGLFDRVVPAAQVLPEARTLAAQWAAQPRLAVQRAKEALYRSGSSSLPDMLDLEIAHQTELFATADARERIARSLTTRSR